MSYPIMLPIHKVEEHLNKIDELVDEQDKAEFRITSAVKRETDAIRKLLTSAR